MHSKLHNPIHFFKFRKYREPHLRPWFDALENGLEQAGFHPIICPSNQMTAFAGKILHRCGLLHRLSNGGPDHAIVPMLHLSVYRVFPKCRSLNLVPYCLDVWEPELHLWKRFFAQFSIERAFFSSSEACTAISQQCPWLDAAWIPEGLDLNDFLSGDVLRARKIDVLELGRKHSTWHDQVANTLRDSGFVHLYEQAPGLRVFGDDGLLRKDWRIAKISVCFPSSITHPERSGSFETTTSRYFQSMASRCIILGHAPAELTADFGYCLRGSGAL